VMLYEIEQARERLAYAIREQMRFEKMMEVDDEAAQRTLGKARPRREGGRERTWRLLRGDPSIPLKV